MAPGLYWVLRLVLRWSPVFGQPFNHRLSQRYENKLLEVDIFECTTDPVIEPPMIVINTVLSVMTYDYPTEKLNVYLSNDTGLDITFYAPREASNFAKHWLPFCKRFKVEPRSPAAYFKSITSSATCPNNSIHAKELVAIKGEDLYLGFALNTKETQLDFLEMFYGKLAGGLISYTPIMA